MSKLTEQHFFDETVKHIIDQGVRSVDASSFCIYLSAEGNTCAIGHWIPDGHPGQKCQGTLDALVVTHPDLVGVCVPKTPLGMSLGMQLQQLHDRSLFSDRNSGAFKKRVIDIAKEFGLNLDAKLI